MLALLGDDVTVEFGNVGIGTREAELDGLLERGGVGPLDVDELAVGREALLDQPRAEARQGSAATAAAIRPSGCNGCRRRSDAAETNVFASISADLRPHARGNGSIRRLPIATARCVDFHPGIP